MFNELLYWTAPYCKGALQDGDAVCALGALNLAFNEPNRIVSLSGNSYTVNNFSETLKQIYKAYPCARTAIINLNDGFTHIEGKSKRILMMEEVSRARQVNGNPAMARKVLYKIAQKSGLIPAEEKELCQVVS